MSSITYYSDQKKQICNKVVQNRKNEQLEEYTQLQLMDKARKLLKATVATTVWRLGQPENKLVFQIGMHVQRDGILSTDFHLNPDGPCFKTQDIIGLEHVCFPSKFWNPTFIHRSINKQPAFGLNQTIHSNVPFCIVESGLRSQYQTTHRTRWKIIHTTTDPIHLSSQTVRRIVDL